MANCYIDTSADDVEGQVYIRSVVRAPCKLNRVTIDS
jgi:hypothetical protein